MTNWIISCDRNLIKKIHNVRRYFTMIGATLIAFIDLYCTINSNHPNYILIAQKSNSSLFFVPTHTFIEVE